MGNKKVEEIKIELPLRNGNSGQGRAWYATHAERQKFEQYIVAAGKKKKVPYMFPVALHVIRCYGKRQRVWDADSVLRGNWKQLQDALVACGWFQDDNPSHIMQVVGSQRKAEDGVESVIVEVWTQPAVFRCGQHSRAGPCGR
jgi:hypothetical protein